MKINELINKIKDMKSPICIELNGNMNYIPEDLVKEEMDKRRWKSPKVLADLITTFNKEVIDIISASIPAISIPLQNYIVLGADGIRSYIDTLHYAKKHNIFTIANVNIGDIPSSAESYANAYIGKYKIDGIDYPMYDADIISINPYSGYNFIEQFIYIANRYNKGILVTLHTTENNTDIQNLDVCISNGNSHECVPLYCKIGEYINSLLPEKDDNGYYQLGYVLEASNSNILSNIRKLFPSNFLFVTNYSNNQIYNLAPAFNILNRNGAIINYSSGILDSHIRDTYVGLKWRDAINKAVTESIYDIRQVLSL